MHIENLLLRDVLTLRQSSQIEGVWNLKKKIYTSRLRERLESYSASIASTAFDSTNNRCLITDRLESNFLSNYRQGLRIQPCLNQRQGSRVHPATTALSSFTNASDIPDVTPVSIKALVRATLCGVDIVIA